jgi:hypothetical protein
MLIADEMMRPWRDIARQILPSCDMSNSDLDRLLFMHTGIQSYWEIGVDGDTPEECFRTQLGRYVACQAQIAILKDFTDDKLAERWPRIQPIVRNAAGEPWFIEPVDPSEVSYIWSPVLKAPAPAGLQEIARGRAFISFGYHGIFKPSIRECLAFLPAEHEAECIAFEIVAQPEDAADLQAERTALDMGYHVCEVAYYGRRE